MYIKQVWIGPYVEKKNYIGATRTTSWVRTPSWWLTIGLEARATRPLRHPLRAVLELTTLAALTDNRPCVEPTPCACRELPVISA
jgi:hypothetical protein